MFTYNLAYRYSNGEIEGFTGSSLSGTTEARSAAVARVVRKIGDIQISRPTEPNYDEERLIENDHSKIEDMDGITSAELDQIKRDWKISSP